MSNWMSSCVTSQMTTGFVSPTPLSTCKRRHSTCTRPRRASFTIRTTRSYKVACSAVTSPASRLRLEISTIAGEERGIFGLEDEQRESLDSLIRAVERENPTHSPTANNAEAASGSWRLLYTNLEILGRRRVRLAIGTSKKSGFVALGEFVQIIDSNIQQSKNVVSFRALVGGGGTFTITAEYKVVDDKRVSVKTIGSSVRPESFERLLGQNRSLLLEIFDPEGFLDVTYVDESLRIGRDDKGHVFVLEKMQTEQA